MNRDILNVTSNLASLDKTYAPLDVWGNTVGRYFDYKKETAMIEHATVKLKEQTKVILKQIDSELEKELDRNDKQFKQEMFRLQTIACELDSGSLVKESILKNISELVDKLGDETLPDKVKEQIPQLIAMAHQQLNDERQSGMQNLRLMQGFDPSQKLIN
jgi:F0F1-type ATP synthase membrane subunit b/b'